MKAADQTKGAAVLPRPTAANLAAAAHKLLPDVIAADLRVLFCGINPSLYSAAVGHHFARPGNRFWPTLFRAGFTPRLFSPAEDRELIRVGCGVTNLVPRATTAADELSDDELRAGAKSLARKLRRYRPRWIAFVGLGAYRTAFARPKAPIGPQAESIADTRIWLLPNTSGLNANHQAADLAELFGELRRTAFA
jgi:TDG/mug DNA glycosylase family protein